MNNVADRLKDALRHHGNIEILEGRAREAIAEIERLEAKCFALSVGVCEYRSGNEHGNPICLKTNQLI